MTIILRTLWAPIIVTYLVGLFMVSNIDGSDVALTKKEEKGSQSVLGLTTTKNHTGREKLRKQIIAELAHAKDENKINSHKSEDKRDRLLNNRKLHKKWSSSNKWKKKNWSSSNKWNTSNNRQRWHTTNEKKNQWWYDSSFSNTSNNYIPYNPNWNYQLHNPYVPNTAPVPAGPMPTPVATPTAPTAPAAPFQPFAPFPTPSIPAPPSDPTSNCVDPKDCPRPPRPWEVQE